MLTFSNFFTNIGPVSQTSSSDIQAGYIISNLDILSQKTLKTQSIHNNRVLDFMRIENDPNVSRPKLQPDLEKTLGKLSIVTQMVKMVDTQLYAAHIHEYLPANVMSLLDNFQALTDTPINTMSYIQNQLTFKQIGQAVLSDLISQYFDGDMTFNNLVAMSQSVQTNFLQQPLQKNDAIRAVLSLGLQNFLPEDMTDVLSSLQYLDTLDEVFDSPTEKTIFTDKLNQLFETEQQRQISTVTTRDYSNLYIDLSDPLGLVVQSQFRNDIFNNHVDVVNAFLATENLTIPEQQQIAGVLFTDMDGNLDSAFSGRNCLPSLSHVSKSVIADSSNKTITQIKTSIQTVINLIIKDLDINPAPEDQQPVDYLFNLKKNIQFRNDLKNSGATSEKFDELGLYFTTIFPNGKYSEKDIDLLDAKLQVLLKETTEVC